MNRFWRLALIWLLAVALPIQGYAAQTMLLCGPANHQQGAAIDAHAGHDHDHGSRVSDEASHPAMAMVGEAAQHADNASDGHAKHAGKCSVCSSCCSAVAITTHVVHVAVMPPDLPEVPTLQFAHDRVMVGGLERPPRFSPA